MKRPAVLKHLHAHGCSKVREGSSHTIYENPATGQRAPVPRHNELPLPLVKVICKQLGIPTP